MNKSNFFSKKYARLVSSYPVQVLLVIFALLVFSMFSLSNFKLDASSDSLVLEGDDDLKYYRQINSDYASSDFLVVLFKPNEELFSKPVISVVRSLSDSLESINGVSSVLSYLDAPLLFSPKMSITELADNLRTIELGKQEIKIHCNSNYKRENNESMTFYDVIRRTYTKKHNLLEKKFMKFILSYKARFTPE